MQFIRFLMSAILVINFQIKNASAQDEGVKWDYTATEIPGICQGFIDQAKEKVQKIVEIEASSRTFENTVLALEGINGDLLDGINVIIGLQYYHPDEKVIEESGNCEGALKNFSVEVNSRAELYAALNGQKSRTALEERLYSETLKEFVNNGASLPADKIQQFRDLKAKLKGAEIQYNKNLNADKTTIELSEIEIAGASNDYIGGLKTAASGNYIVKTKMNDVTNILNNVSSGEARKKFYFARINRQAEVNTQLLETAVQYRQEIASLLGYSSWAQLRIQSKMAKELKSVRDFLTSVRRDLQSKKEKDFALLLKYKQEVEPSAIQVNVWDVDYLENQIKKRDFGIDEEAIKEYFPTNQVVQGIFKIYQKILGVEFSEVKDPQVWAKDVSLYRVTDAKSKKVVGYFYADLYPRDNKYPHAGAADLRRARQLKNGSFAKPVAIMLANFSPATEKKPALLTHREVEIFFHEFGHLMHNVLSLSPYASFSGAYVAQDFVEAPSQMLQNWVWDKKILNDLSGHYLDHNKKIPEKTIDAMLKARNFNQAFYYTSQIQKATFDLDIHTAAGQVNVTEVYDQTFKEITGLEPIEGGHYGASFGHLMGDYDAGYYGYIWSKVYAEDMFTRFQKGGLLSSKVGKQYRDIILASGNTKEASILLREFLGREPNQKAFLKSLGISKK